MPAHAIGTVSVTVEKQAVETHADLLVQELAQHTQLRRPRADGLLQSAVAIGAARISNPASEPRGAVLPAIHRYPRLLPGNGGSQCGTEGNGVDAALLQPGRRMTQSETGTGNRNHGDAAENERSGLA